MVGKHQPCSSAGLHETWIPLGANACTRHAWPNNLMAGACIVSSSSSSSGGISQSLGVTYSAVLVHLKGSPASFSAAVARLSAPDCTSLCCCMRHGCLPSPAPLLRSSSSVAKLCCIQDAFMLLDSLHTPSPSLPSLPLPISCPRQHRFTALVPPWQRSAAIRMPACCSIPLTLHRCPSFLFLI